MKTVVQTRRLATVKLLSLVRHMSVHQPITDVDRLPPPTDSRRIGTV